jgi:hypothetical protein
MNIEHNEHLFISPPYHHHTTTVTRQHAHDYNYLHSPQRHQENVKLLKYYLIYLNELKEKTCLFLS